MSNGEIDRLQVNQLSDRYNLARSAVYERIKALGIQTEKIGNKAFVNSEQLKLLDEFHEFIQRGGTAAEFREMRGIQKAEEAPELSSGLSAAPSEMFGIITAIVSEVAARFQPPTPEPNPLGYYEFLEQAAQKGWLLRTSEVANLLDLPPSELRQYGDSFSEAGFVFTKAGYRSQGEVAWRVSKPVK